MADFLRLVEKLGFHLCYCHFRQMAKPSILKVFLTFCEDGEKDGGFPQPYGEAGMPMVGVDPALVLCYRDEYKLRWARNVASLTSYWRMNGWQGT